MEDQNKFKNKKTTLYIIVAILAITSLCYRLISNFHFEQTAILFVGLPALITVLVIRYTNTPKTAYGIVFKVITLFLLMSSVLFGEGIICILMAAPIFYGVSALIVFLVKRLKEQDKSKLNAVVLIPVLLFCAQITDLVGPVKYEKISVSKTFDHTVSFNDLNQTPDFMENLPAFFKMGFPKPIKIEGQGYEIGDERKVYFKSSTKGIGILRLRVTEKTDSKLTFEAISDDSHIAHWLTWKKIEMKISKRQDGTSKIDWEVNYTCDLQPSWYFGPMERFAVAKSSYFLIDSYFQR